MAELIKSTPEKYFLYIDILGFSSLVLQDRVKDLYDRLDSLNAHTHRSFSTLVFSDTIVIYNKDDLDWDENDKMAIVSRLCEFAADLFYRLISQDIHFRGYICQGQFIHFKMKNIDAFYGRALVQSYVREREIHCTGLFIANELVPYLGFLESSEYDEYCHYVHLMESLNDITFDREDYPLHENLVAPLGLDVFAAYDISYLRNIHAHMNNINLSPRVRVKYLSAWQIIRQRHQALLDVLEQADFDPNSVCDIDWKPAFAKIGTSGGYFG